MVKGALQRILVYLKNPRTEPVALFSSDVELVVVTIPETMAKDYYMCGKNFYLGSLQCYSQLKWGLLVIDTSEASLGLLQNGRVSLLKHYQFYIHGKIKAGGQSSQRFQETRRKCIDSMIREVSDSVSQILKEHNPSKIILGGVSPTVEKFYYNNCMEQQLRDKVQAPVSTCYTNPMGLDQLVKKIAPSYQEELKDYLVQERLYKALIRGMVNGTVVPLASLQYQPMDTRPRFILVQGMSYPQMYCTQCRVYGKSLPCDHGKTPLSSCDSYAFKPGSNADFIRARYRGLVQLEPVTQGS